MRKHTFLTLFFVLMIARLVAQSGFSSVTSLAPVGIVFNTGETPQAKVWTYDGKWWSVLGTASGAILFRLDGTTWTNVLTLASGGSIKADVKVVGNVVHIFTWKGTTSYLSSVEYDATNKTYKLWTARKTRVSIALDKGVQSGTIDVDATGRMWLASDGTTTMSVRWSDAPYATWSAPVTIASGTTDADQCAVVALPGSGKVGVFWSNQNSQRFGFKTHSDGSDPTAWSADEVPASQSALSIGSGMASNQFNLKVTADGTLYGAVKTGYGTGGYPQLGLLLRHGDGSWDPLYPVTLTEGAHPVVLVNEAQGKIKVVYTTVSNGGDIMYRESAASNISFGAELTLIDGAYDYATSTKSTYSSETVILASNATTAVGVLASDGGSAPITQRNGSAGAVVDRQFLKAALVAYPNPFSATTTLSFTLPHSGTYTLTLQDSRGRKVALLKQGWAEAGLTNRVRVEGAQLTNGLYFISLQTNEGIQTVKVIVNR